MAGKKFTEPIEIKINTYATDTAGGRTVSGTTLIDTVNVTIEQKPQKYSGDGVQQSIKGEYLIREMWINPAYTLTLNHFIEWRSKRLEITAIAPTDDFLKLSLTLKEQ